MSYVTEQMKIFFEEKGITQTSIAEMFGTSPQYVNQLLSGKKSLGKGTARRLHDYYGFSIPWLLTGEGEMLDTEPLRPQPAPAISQQNVNGDNTINGGGSGEDARVFKALYTEKCKENEALNLRVAKLMAKLMDLGIDINGCDL